MSDEDAPGLIADIGGTNARFALVAAGEEPKHALVLPCIDYAGPAEAASAYLHRVAPGCRPSRGAFAIAGPVAGDHIAMTNHPWQFSVSEVRDRLGARHLEVVNDFTAVALSVSKLKPQDVVLVGGGAPIPDMPIAVLGPGTGLGMSGLIPTPGGFTPLVTEGGHATMPASDERESRVLDWLRGLFDHVSAERVISGPGLVNLYSALCELEGREPEPMPPDQVSGRALDGSCPICAEALDMFFAMLGTVAGNFALSLGARQGVYIAGGIVPRLKAAFLQSRFRERFEAKGRFRSYLAAIPVHLIVHRYPAFLGLAGLVQPPR